ncbi:MAG: malonic semialdehyde reductase [Proteobacteria bacterium]|nr:malonic semialdehyde reductase [Pseudomonadota bacterium]MDA0983640.1 malonic semialdehyde reductase [Pseudomonadota bacterium]
MLDSQALDTIFRTARSQNGFLDKSVEDAQIRALYELMKFGPTTMNTQPARFVFVKSKAAKDKLRPALSPGNLDKTMAAPATVIVAYDLRFYEFLPRTFPNNPNAKGIFEGKDATNQVVCMRNGSLQGAYLIIAARALGLDCGPMSGFDNAKLDAAFFPDGRWKSNFICNLGTGDPAKVFGRNPRLTFEEACRIE